MRAKFPHEADEECVLTIENYSGNAVVTCETHGQRLVTFDKDVEFIYVSNNAHNTCIAHTPVKADYMEAED